jgi:hypothetical protein
MVEARASRLCVKYIVRCRYVRDLGTITEWRGFGRSAKGADVVSRSMCGFDL